MAATDTGNGLPGGGFESPALALFVGRPDPGVVVVTLTGELDMDTAPLLRRAVDAALTPSLRRLVLDLGSVAFFGSAGVSELLSTRDRVAAQGSELHLRGVHDNRRVERVLDLTGLLKHFVIHPGPGDARTDPAPG